MEAVNVISSLSKLLLLLLLILLGSLAREICHGRVVLIRIETVRNFRCSYWNVFIYDSDHHFVGLVGDTALPMDCFPRLQR